MNHKLIKCISIFLGILISASLLSGANVMFESWFAAPEIISKVLIMLLSFIGTIKIINITLSYFILKK